MELPDPRHGRWMALIYRWILIQVLIVLSQIATGEQNLVGGSENRTRRLIRVATIQIDPYVRLNWSPGLIANERYEGLFIDLLKEIAEEAGLAYQLYLVPDGKIGQLGDNGHWNGLIGELERGSADVALAPIVATEERRQAVNFLSPLSPVSISSLSREGATSDLPYGVVLQSEALYAVKRNPELYDVIKRRGLVYASSIMEGLDMAREGRCVLLLHSQLADYYADQEPCDLTVEPFHDFHRLHFSIATSPRAGEIWRDLRSVLDRLIDRGALIETLEQRWLRGRCMRKGTLPTSPETTVNTDTQKMWTKLYVTSVVVEPYLMRSNKHGVQFEGYIADLVEQIAQVLSVDYEWKIQRRVGRQRKDGSWTGMIGELTKGKADLAAAPFVLDDDQKSVLSLSKPFLESTLSLVVKAPPGGGEAPIVVIEDLLNQSSYDYGVVYKSRLARQLRRSPLPIYRRLWARLKARRAEAGIRTVADGLDRVRRGDFALLMESPEATYLASRRPCDLVALSQYLAVAHYAFATAKDSALVEHLNLALLQLQEQGVLQALFHRWWNADQCGDDRKSAEPQPEAGDRSTSTSSTTTTTTVPLKPLLEFDIDEVFGLSTEQYPLTGNGSDYDALDDVEADDVRDMERIFLTSPVSAFTPRKPVGDVIAEPTFSLPVSLATSTSALTPVDGADVKKNDTAPTEVGYDSAVEAAVTTAGNDVIRHTTEMSAADVVIPTSNVLTTTTTRKSRRKGRKRRPKKRKGRRRNGATPALMTSSTADVTRTSTAPTPRHRSRDFNRNIDWFFVTQLPRPEEYDDYDIYNGSNDVNVTLVTADRSAPALPPLSSSSPEVAATPKSATSRTTDAQPNSTVRSKAAPEAEVSTAVLVVVVINLVIFGWPPAAAQSCYENCDR